MKEILSPYTNFPTGESARKVNSFFLTGYGRGKTIMINVAIWVIPSTALIETVETYLRDEEQESEGIAKSVQHNANLQSELTKSSFLVEMPERCSGRVQATSRRHDS